MTFMELSRETETLLGQSAALAEKLGYQTAAEEIQEQIKARKARELMVVVAGEARRGKSSLLNALLNETSPVFPVDVNVCTNVVTVLRYGEKETIEVYIEDAGSPNGHHVVCIQRSELQNYVSELGNPNNYKKVKMVNASIRNDLLREGIVFVDTPGVGSLNIEHAETTIGFLPNADLLLFVTDTLSGLTESELNFLRRGYSCCKSVVFPVTKKDQNPDYETIVQDNREKISRTLEIPEDEVQIIPVSSTAKQRALQRGSKAMYANSNFAALERCIWTTIARRRGEVLLLPYLTGGRVELTKLMDNVAAQYQTLGNQLVASDLTTQLNGLVERLDGLQDRGADWRTELNLFFSILQTTVNTRQQTISQEAREWVDKQIQRQGINLCQQANYQQLISEVNERITGGLLEIRELIFDETEQKMNALQNQLELSMGVNEEILNKLSFQPSALDITFPDKKLSDRLITKGRNFTMNTMGGTAVGSVLGGLVGFCLGGPAGLLAGVEYGSMAGSLFGGTKGCMEALSKYDQMDVAAISKALNRHITTSMIGIGDNVSKVLTELRLTMSGSYERQLKKRIQELQENIGQLKKNIALAQNEIPRRQAELKAQANQFNQMLKRFDALMKECACPEVPQQGKTRQDAQKRESVRQEKPETDPPARENEVSYGFL